MKTMIEWHKYPEEKPELDVPLLFWDGKDVFEGYCFLASPKLNIWFSASDPSRCDENAIVQGIIGWAYMPEGPIL